jgi:hypothetical protein
MPGGNSRAGAVGRGPRRPRFLIIPEYNGAAAHIFEPAGGLGLCSERAMEEFIGRATDFEISSGYSPDVADIGLCSPMPHMPDRMSEEVEPISTLKAKIFAHAQLPCTLLRLPAHAVSAGAVPSPMRPAGEPVPAPADLTSRVGEPVAGGRTGSG